MRQIVHVFAAAAVALAVGACSNPQSAPEPENETVAEAMPDTPDISDTADETPAGGRPDAPIATAEPAPAPAPAN